MASPDYDKYSNPDIRVIGGWSLHFRVEKREDFFGFAELGAKKR